MEWVAIFILKLYFSLNNLQITKTPKLTKTLKNDKAKGLANANKGVKYAIFGTQQVAYTENPSPNHGSLTSKE
jgi:hypothetical protein